LGKKKTSVLSALSSSLIAISYNPYITVEHTAEHIINIEI